MENCKFCDIVNGKVNDYKIWENDKFLVFLDATPANPGHCMLIPKKHVDYFFDLEDELYHELFKIAKKISEPLRIAMNAKRIGIAVVGFNVPHAHLHLVPLHGSNELFDPKMFNKANEEELKKIQEKLISHLKGI